MTSNPGLLPSGWDRDALDPNFDLAAFERALFGRKGAIKAVLMDQAVIAGIGKIYSDEILFQAGLHPNTPARRLDAAARKHCCSRSSTCCQPTG